MSVFQLVFSPTGGTKKSADLFMEAFSPERTLIDLSDPHCDYDALSFRAEDVCLIAVPSFGGRAPKDAIARLSRIHGGGASAILMVVYGNRDYEDTLLELQDTLEARNFRCVAAMTTVAEHSFLHQYATGRPNADDAAELAAFAGSIRSKLESGEGAPLSLPGNRPYRSFDGIPMKPKAGRACTQCGLCAKNCPVNAIPLDHPNETDTSRCISCMRCISICPQQARHVNKLMVTMVGTAMKKHFAQYKKAELFL